MSDNEYGATIGKRRLARRLEELRLQSGRTVNDITDALGWPQGQLQRFERNQWNRPDPDEVRRLLSLFGLADAVRDELDDLTLLAHASPWWRSYSELFRNDFPGFENDATQICLFMPITLPDLLQTQEYSEAQVRSFPVPLAIKQRILETRRRRQEILHQGGRIQPRIVAIIHEASLVGWGTKEDRLEQIQHLIWLSDHPQISIHLLRPADGSLPPVMPPINHFEFPGNEPPITFIQDNYRFYEVNSEEANDYLSSISHAISRALTAADTSAYLRHLAGEPAAMPAIRIRELAEVRNTTTPRMPPDQQALLREWHLEEPPITFVQLARERTSATLELHTDYYTYYWQTLFNAADFLHYLQQRQDHTVAAVTVVDDLGSMNQLPVAEAADMASRRAKGIPSRPEWVLVRFDGLEQSWAWQYAPNKIDDNTSEHEIGAYIGCASSGGHMQNFAHANELLAESATYSETLLPGLHLFEHYLSRWIP